MKSSAIKCPACGAGAMLVGGAAIYPHRPDLKSKRFWKCVDCGDSYVGVHPGGKRPLGTLADAPTRRARSAAHAAFDPMWKHGRMKRKDAYAWLAKELGIKVQDCHISWFDAATCWRVVDICAAEKVGVK